MKRIFKKFSLILCLLGFLTLPYFVFAAPPLSALKTVGNDAGYSQATNETTVSVIAGGIVRTVLGLLGIIFIILIVYAGIIWMTAQGEEAKVEKAQTIMRNAIIGLVITIGVYAIYALIRTLSFAVSK
jgi:hypothetical protein